ncbi:MAG: hypothetical protein Q8P57_02685 [Candidatus Pacearchaeota archaeon]|nr:hypothetical protein [Candidatus Pacearchaeota archaeon]
MNKRGQVFLMAAVIIAGLVLGASRTVNYAHIGNNQEAFYDLSEEIDFEAGRVLDYGVINNLNPRTKLISFLDEYTEYIGKEEFVFVYGDINNLQAINYETIEYPNSILLITGSGEGISFPISKTLQTNTNAFSDGEEVRVKVREITYTFNLKPGYNFYIVIIKGEGGEKFVAVR